MEGTRKNVRSEYKNVGKWGFVPKLCVTLLAALIILSLAGCKNTADGGVGSSGGGGAAPAAPAPIMPDLVDGFESGVAYAFYDGERRVGRYSTTDDAKTFSEIKQKIGVAAIESVENDSSFLGWQIEETGELVASDEQSFSSDTKFVASYKEAGNSKPIEKGEDLVGETSDAYGWYSEANKAFLIFNCEGGEAGECYIVAGKGFTTSLFIVKEYFTKDREKYNYDSRSNERKALDVELDKLRVDNGIETCGWWLDAGAWGTDLISIFVMSNFSMNTYSLSANGKALVDVATGEVAYRRVTIND